ncbi:MAG: sigma-70 family RNA polymerase sigma factor [Deltaproteobacteria bacterium]|nr:sigma-70 family RNA polymerase sigma factor [Deltaproteobacteria bacterium]
MSTDDELLEAWRGGDKHAGETLFDRHFKALTRFFRNKAGDDFDDLIQQTVVTLLEAKGLYRGEGSFRSFVFGVAYNVLRNHYRRARRDAERLDFGVTSVFELGVGPVEVLADRHEQRLLLQALRKIPLEHQVLLELYFWEPMIAPDIAAVFEVPEGTIRTRLRRAKALLEQELGALSANPALLHSTLSNLDDWAKSVRGGVAV